MRSAPPVRPSSPAVVAPIAAALLLAPAACGSDATLPAGCDRFVRPSADDDTNVQEMFLDAADGETVCLSAGTFEFTRQLTVSAKDLTIQGQSQADTILNFAKQDVGGSGIQISGDGVTIRRMTVEETPGDGIFATSVQGINFEDLTVRWMNQQNLANGAYGVYPVKSSDVVVRRVTVQGARDAGIYVGQSQNILVEDSLAFDNVAGIEIENSFDAVVRNNEAYDNTGGILVFNLPGLEIKNGERTLIYGNDVHDNNVDNWGEDGTAVAAVPRGTGLLILASDGNEVRDNIFRNLDSFGVVVASYILLDPTMGYAMTDPQFEAYAEANYVHDNTFENIGANPDELPDSVVNVDPVPPLVFDGCLNPDHDNSGGDFTNCFENNTADGAAATYYDIDVCGMPPFANQDQDLGPVTCSRTPIEDPYPTGGEAGPD